MKPNTKEKPLRKKKRIVQTKKITSKSVKSIDRKVIEDELKQSQEELRNLTRHLQSVREEERTSIAREMHDELGQKLTAQKMELSWLKTKLPQKNKTLLKSVDATLTLSDSIIESVHRISAELRPKILDELGLGPTMEWQAEEFEKRTGIQCKVNIDPEDIKLDKELSTSLFRIFQESLTNVARYAKASKVDISLFQMGGVLELRIQGNGKGISGDDLTKSNSFGLLGMRERVRYLGGEFSIDGKNKGTTIKVKIPMQEAMGRPLLTAPKMVGREKELRKIRLILEKIGQDRQDGLDRGKRDQKLNLKTVKSDKPALSAGRDGQDLKTGKPAFRTDRNVYPPKIVLIHGEAGIGKSRLVREVQQDIVSWGGITLQGNCYEETRTIPYYPYRDALKRFFEINKEDVVSIFNKLPKYSQWELTRILPGLKLKEATKFEKSSDKYRLYEAVRLFFENISSVGAYSPNRAGITPLLIIEDLHWSDEASLDLLYYLARNLSSGHGALPHRQAGIAPYLLLGTYRTEESESYRGIGKLSTSLKKEDLAEEIALHPLPLKEVSTLLNQLTPSMKQSKQFQDDLYKKTEGNPFFVEELLRSYDLVMLNSIQHLKGSLDIEKVPESIQSVLKRRIGSLTSSCLWSFNRR
jgi:two-component sensor histidine kinase